MTTLKNLPVDDLNMLLHVVQQSFSVRQHYQLFSWLQEDVQLFVPHDVVIAAWGDFRSGEVSYDIISPLPGLRTNDFDNKAVLAFMAPLFARWHQCGHAPYVVKAANGFSETEISNPLTRDIMSRMRSCLVHGIKDQRGRHDCIYALLGPTELGSDRSKLTLRFLLPYIDTAFRQVAHLPEQQLNDGIVIPALEPELVQGSRCGMSQREQEIMNWVCKGKTNQEIGMILEISAFTVKNHLQRIFKKLDVMNRAQAVSKIETKFNHATK
ncbi:MAG TPA: transcriptional regulator EpsA [Gemmatales bacterium]|nr:transcriptional regulator EpsA [Gemmatales bacterium]